MRTMVEDRQPSDRNCSAREEHKRREPNDLVSEDSRDDTCSLQRVLVR